MIPRWSDLLLSNETEKLIGIDVRRLDYVCDELDLWEIYPLAEWPQGATKRQNKYARTFS